MFPSICRYLPQSAKSDFSQGVELVQIEADAEKLAAWHAEAARLVEAGMEKKIEPFNEALMSEAVKVASEEYVVERS